MYALTIVRASGNVWPLARSAYMGCWVTWGSDTWLSSDRGRIPPSTPAGEPACSRGCSPRRWPAPRPALVRGGARERTPARPPRPRRCRRALVADVARARALARRGGHPELPARAEVLALAQSIEARAVREGAGARAVELHTVAARLLERVWRVEGREQDAERGARPLPRRRARARRARARARPRSPPRASPATSPATPPSTYAELYRAQRRFASVAGDRDAGGGPTACRRELEDGLALLVGLPPAAARARGDRRGARGRGRHRAVAARRALDAGVVTSAVRPPQIVRIEAWPGRDAARVVVVLDRPAVYRVGDEVLSGTGAPRTFLDLDGVDLGASPRDTPLHRHRHARARRGDDHRLARVARPRRPRVASRLLHARALPHRRRRRAPPARRRRAATRAPSRASCSTPATAARTPAPSAPAA